MTDHTLLIVLLTLVVICIVLFIPDARSDRNHDELDRQIAELEKLIRERHRQARK